MTTEPAGNLDSKAVSFRDAHWKTKWLVFALVFLLVWRSVSLVGNERLALIPYWLLLIVTGLIPQLFLLFYPLATRTPNRRQTFAFPSLKCCLVEFGISIPIVIGAIIVLAAVNYFLEQFAPGTSLTPDAMTNMARSPKFLQTYAWLLFSFTLGPLAEELFFRGFLYNAFRARMPFILALFAQSLIFGFSHFFGTIHALVAFILGLLLTVVYEWRKTLIAPIFVHAGINFIGTLSLLVAMVTFANSPVIGINGDPHDTECIIRNIYPGSAAEEADLHVGDIITSINDEPIQDFTHLVNTVPRYKPGDSILVTINRSGEILEILVTLQRRGEP